MGRVGRATSAVVGGSLLPAVPPIVCWLTGHRDSDFIGLGLLGGLLLTSPFLGYQLRGFPRLPTWILVATVWVIPVHLALALLSTAPELPVLFHLKSALLELATLGILSLDYPRGIHLSLPGIWLWLILPTLIWQGFFEGLLGPLPPGNTEEANPA